MTLKIGKQKIKIIILLNISISKGDQTIKFGQLMNLRQGGRKTSYKPLFIF